MAKISKESEKGGTRQCLNCGNTGKGTYCSDCGQNYSDLNRPMKDLLKEFMDSINLDRRLIRTIIPFVIRPGYLAIEYLNGRRRTYMSPLRLYIVMSLIFFFLALNSTTEKDLADTANLSISESDSSYKIIASETELLRYLTADTSGAGDVTLPGLDVDSTAVTNSGSWVNKAAIKALTNRELFIKNFYRNLSYILFFLMPVFALILFILYIRRRHFYVEHLVFSLNMHSFTLLILSLLLIINMIWKGNNMSAWLMLLIPIYFTAGMKRFYRQSWIKTIGKEFILGIVYSILLLLAFPVVGLITLYLI